jgi:secreted PhoX family phosphatase
MSTTDGSTIAPADAFGSPDGLAFDDDGRLWIETDGSQPITCNNQMLAADPATGDVRRFLVGPRGCEITGWAITDDQRTLFVNIQHPGEGATDPANPASQSTGRTAKVVPDPRPSPSVEPTAAPSGTRNASLRGQSRICDRAQMARR